MRQEQLQERLDERFLACDLYRLPAAQYLHSSNRVARLNLVNMAYAPEQRLEVYACAQDGLAGLESNWDQRLKYADFIDGYARLSEAEWEQYRREYLADSDQREVIMGMLSYSRKEGLQQGESLLLRRLLTRRFGPLPEWAERRLTDAEPAQLERWGERVLEAATLEAVLADG